MDKPGLVRPSAPNDHSLRGKPSKLFGDVDQIGVTKTQSLVSRSSEAPLDPFLIHGRVLDLIGVTESTRPATVHRGRLPAWHTLQGKAVHAGISLLHCGTNVLLVEGGPR